MGGILLAPLPPVPFIDRKTLSVLSTTLAVAAVLWLLWAARLPVLAFLFAMFFAYLLEPAVRWAEKRVGGSRARAILVIYLALIAAIAGAIAIAAPRIARDAPALAKTLPAIADQVSSGDIAFQIGRSQGWSYQTRAAAKNWLHAHREDVTAIVKSVGARVAEVSANLGWVLLIPILAIFFLKDRGELGDAALSFVRGDRERQFWRSVLNDVDRMLAHYIRAQLLLAMAAMVAYTTFLTAMGFPSGFGLGVLGGFLEFIPFVGPAITAGLILLVGIFTGYPHWLIVIVFLIVWRGLQDYVNAPYIMGHGLELHPLAVLFGILAGGEVAGLPGIFLSIPVMAALRILWRHVQFRGAPAEASASAPRRTSAR
jgi:predicted PurR-regulated permease PerM